MLRPGPNPNDAPVAGQLAVWENARLFALVNVAMADAGILAWYHKLCYYLWRPVIGIREADGSLGPVARSNTNIGDIADPFWTPFGSPRTNEIGPSVKSYTPPFPSYPSGHATFGAAAFQIVRRFYNYETDAPDQIAFEFVSDELNGNSREPTGGRRTRHFRRFNSLADAIYENSVSRVYLGVHWKFDGLNTDINDSVQLLNEWGAGTLTIGGVPLGLAVADDIFENGMTMPDPANAKCSEIVEDRTGGDCAWGGAEVAARRSARDAVRG
jgi:vanadium chloroperoxidase